MTTNQILLGLGLVLILAVGSPAAARRLEDARDRRAASGRLSRRGRHRRCPPGEPARGPLPAVRLDRGRGRPLRGGPALVVRRVGAPHHKVVTRLVTAGIVLTCAGIAVTVALLFGDTGSGVAVLIGAILVVSGPTVVLPLLAFIRPARDLRSLLKWEGRSRRPARGAARRPRLPDRARREAGSRETCWSSLVIGRSSAAVGAPGPVVVVSGGCSGGTSNGRGRDAGCRGGRGRGRRSPPRGCGLRRGDHVGISLGNQRPSRIAAHQYLVTLEFQETLVQLLIGVLFVLVAASVTPARSAAVMPEALVLVAVMIADHPARRRRPDHTGGTANTMRERAFVAWMAPRGIVAGATASAFGPTPQSGWPARAMHPSDRVPRHLRHGRGLRLHGPAPSPACSG